MENLSMISFKADIINEAAHCLKEISKRAATTQEYYITSRVNFAMRNFFSAGRII